MLSFDILVLIVVGVAAIGGFMRGFVQEVEHATHGAVRVLGWPARMSESAVPIKAAPLLGEHSSEVVAADLGLPADKIAALVAEGVIAQS